MRRLVWLSGWVICLVGCISANEERLHEYNDDGIFLFQKGAFSDARLSFEAALTLKPDDPAILYNIGKCYDRQDARGQAELYYNRCLNEEPNNVACRRALVALMVRDGRTPDATHMAEDWLAREPKKAEPYALDGLLWHQAGDLPKAQGRLQQALGIDPHNVDALIELGLIFEAMHRLDRAQALYEKVLELEPNRPDVVARLNQLQHQGVGPPRPD